MHRELIDRLQVFRTRVRRAQTVNVNDRGTKAEATSLATSYFETHRPALVAALGESNAITAHDELWHDLVRLAHGNNARRTYASTLRAVIRGLTELSVSSLSRATGASGGTDRLSTLTPAEHQIVSTLETLLPTAAASYRQGILDLQGTDRLSYRGTASEFREALREALDHLAPDEQVTQQATFRFEDGQTQPTMKQKVRYIMATRGRKRTQRDVAERSVRGVEDLTAEIVRATYNRASLAAHLETTRAEVQRIRRYVDTVLFDLLEIGDAELGRRTMP